MSTSGLNAARGRLRRAKELYVVLIQALANVVPIILAFNQFERICAYPFAFLLVINQKSHCFNKFLRRVNDEGMLLIHRVNSLDSLPRGHDGQSCSEVLKDL